MSEPKDLAHCSTNLTLLFSEAFIVVICKFKTIAGENSSIPKATSSENYHLSKGKNVNEITFLAFIKFEAPCYIKVKLKPNYKKRPPDFLKRMYYINYQI